METKNFARRTLIPLLLSSGTIKDIEAVQICTAVNGFMISHINQQAKNRRWSNVYNC